MRNGASKTGFGTKAGVGVYRVVIAAETGEVVKIRLSEYLDDAGLAGVAHGLPPFIGGNRCFCTLPAAVRANSFTRIKYFGTL
jgi:hypothetical protein